MRSLELQSGPRINGTSSPQADRDRSSRTTDVAARYLKHFDDGHELWTSPIS